MQYGRIGRAFVWVFSSVAIASGCDAESGKGTPHADAGVTVEADAGPREQGTDAGAPLGVDAGTREEVPDGGPMRVTLPTCDAPVHVVGEMGTVHVPFDTTNGVAGPLDLSDECHAPESMRPAQTVIDYVVPGMPTQETTVELTTVNDATPATFDTLLELRPEHCEVTPTETGRCFDGTGRAAGAIRLMGGTHLYIVVTGFRGVMSWEGAGVLDITARIATAPRIDSGSASFDSLEPGAVVEAEFVVSGADPDGDLDSLEVLTAIPLTSSGAIADTNGDGRGDEGDTSHPTLYSYLAGRRTSFRARGIDIVANESIAQFRLVLTDHAGLTGERVVPVTQRVELGERCDAMHTCRFEHECNAAGQCDLRRAARDVCAAASPIAFVAGGQTSVVAELASLDSGFRGSCGGDGPEAVYSFTTPPGTPAAPYDVLLTTNTAVTGTLDTVLYVRTVCTDASAGAEVRCNDDAGTTTRSSEVTFVPSPATTYFVFVDASFLGNATRPSPRIGLDVFYRPLLASHASCDPAERANRCMSGHCPATGVPVCP